ncbi:MAG: DUF1015 family protein [Kiritimatiellae bacterium]|jgi:uncharacterized protein (DUF1015 family)|nr:DUF1015 family protein [Kiritimatiellia bacterium]
MRIKPFEALRPQKGTEKDVASVPYDVLNTEEAIELSKGNPKSFLHIVRPEIDLPAGTDMYSDAVYNKLGENFRQFVADEFLVRESSPCLYVYKQKMGDHEQRGIVTCCNVEDYENDLILRHEKTRQDKEDDRTRHVETIKANTGPVFLTYKENDFIDAVVAEIEKSEPLFDFVAADGIGHTVWKVEDTAELVSLFEAVPVFYVADGHHRSAAAARAGAQAKANNPNHTGDEEYNWYEAVVFPANQLKILPYNRVVKDLNGLSEDEFLGKVKDFFHVVEGASANPECANSMSMYLAGKWYGLSWSDAPEDDPVEALDVSYLATNLLNPILEIGDLRTTKRVDFIGGIRGTKELEKRVDSGEWAVAFSMYEVSVDQMMAIADAGCIMPPKSTWFEPKLRSGLLVHSF